MSVTTVAWCGGSGGGGGIRPVPRKPRDVQEVQKGASVSSRVGCRLTQGCGAAAVAAMVGSEARGYRVYRTSPTDGNDRAVDGQGVVVGCPLGPLQRAGMDVSDKLHINT